MDDKQLAPLPLESDETRRKRRQVAESFFYTYIVDGMKNRDADESIDAIAELICYGGDLDEITRMMALNL